MSSLASKIAAAPAPVATPVKRGPANACFPLYGAGDLEDWEQIEALRARGFTWREVQDQVDAVLGVENRIPLEKFRYHWRRRCFCWPEDLRR